MMSTVGVPAPAGVAADQRVTPLVDARWLADHLDTPGLVLLHVEDDSASYHLSHLPTARPLAWYDELQELVRRGPVSQRHFEQLMEHKGITRDDHVVFYGLTHSGFAAYAYWLFRHYQHPLLSMLDGGQASWTRSGGELVDAPAVVPSVGPYTSPGADVSLRVGRDEVIARYVGATGDTVLLDCRSSAEFGGARTHPLDLGVERHRVAGRIPGSTSLPHNRLLTASGALRPVEELRDEFSGAGVHDVADVAVYCRVGGYGSLVWFALHEMLGHTTVRHYDGGWAEYGSLVDVPVEIGMAEVDSSIPHGGH